MKTCVSTEGSLCSATPVQGCPQCAIVQPASLQRFAGAAFAIDPRPWTERQESFRLDSLEAGSSFLFLPLQSLFRHSPLSSETKQRLSVSRSCRQSIRGAGLGNLHLTELFRLPQHLQTTAGRDKRETVRATPGQKKWNCDGASHGASVQQDAKEKSDRVNPTGPLVPSHYFAPSDASGTRDAIPNRVSV
jgi:hypothetical protein